MPDPFVVPAVARPTVAVAGNTGVFPVRRIFCVGRNYAEHSREMGATDLRRRRSRRSPPKPWSPAEASCRSRAARRTCTTRSSCVVAVGERREIFGYAAGIDLTRRDVQAQMKKEGKPWDTAKGFEHSAPLSAIAPAADIGHPARGRIWLEVNGQLRQDGDIADMIWAVPEILAELATWFELQAGDLVFTGTPAGVGPLRPGDRVRGGRGWRGRARSHDGGTMKLFSYWRSSAAWRVRIALSWKGIPHGTVPVHLVRDGGQQHSESYHEVNPQERVPALDEDGGCSRSRLRSSSTSRRHTRSRRCSRSISPAGPSSGRWRSPSPAKSTRCRTHAC